MSNKLSHSKADCLAAFKRLQAEVAPANLTRDRYRKESGVPEAVWEYHFGTYAELKRQAGAAPNATAKKLTNAVAKASAAKRFEPLNAERQSYGDTYTRTDKGRYKTILVASDLHDKEIDPFMLRVFLDTAKRAQPDVVSLGGDIFDLPEFGSYTVDPREWDAVGRIKFVHDNVFAPLRKAVPDAQIDLIEGNHECVQEHTEVLTDKGWVQAKNINLDTKVASFSLPTHTVTYEPPIAVASQNNRELIHVRSLYKDEVVTDNHRIVYEGVLRTLNELEDIQGDKLQNAINWRRTDAIDMDEDLVRLAIWVANCGTIYRTDSGKYKHWLCFNGNIPASMRRRIRACVHRIPGLRWEMCGRSVDVKGPRIDEVIELITGQELLEEGRWTDIPDWFERLKPKYGPIVARELAWASTHGFMSKHTCYYSGYGHNIGSRLQWFLSTRGIPCNLRLYPNQKYSMVFNETGGVEYWRGRHVRREELGTGNVVSIQTINGTLITRREGKINYTGNCRLVKHLADFSPATRSILGDLHGWTLGDLFGLSKYQINYIAKADLKSYTAREHRKELENNYKVYYGSVMVHHFPHARHMGLPGVNGHHHSHIVWPMYNVHCGAYEWHQLGAGHRRSASYCEGEKWHNGFAMLHVDTLTKTVNIEYIPVTNMAVVGGKFYTREPNEMVNPK